MKFGIKSIAAMCLISSTAFSSNLFAAKVKGSIPADTAAEKDYPNMAKITLEEAIKAALEKVPGKATEADLGKEDGFLVYDVTIVTGDNKETEVTVDAGDKSILKMDEESWIH